MWLFNQFSSSARTAVIYITVGALTIIWTGVWLVYLMNNPPSNSDVYYWCGGFMASGLILIGIGFGLGQIGRAARHADSAQAVTDPVVATQPVVAPAPAVVSPSVVAPANSTPGVVAAPVGQVVVPPAQVNQAPRSTVAAR